MLSIVWQWVTWWGHKFFVLYDGRLGHSYLEVAPSHRPLIHSPGERHEAGEQPDWQALTFKP